MERTKYFSNSIKRVVVKVGTSTLTYETGKLNLAVMERLVRELADLKNEGLDVILVSSGAVGAGMGVLGLHERALSIPEKQAASSVGQGALMQMYTKFFGEYGHIAGQVLLTRDDMGDRKRYLNARNTLQHLLSLHVIPIINENDTVVVEEIKFTDNDLLSVLVAELVDADLLIILTDTEGLYDCDPRINKSAKLISCVSEVNGKIFDMAGGSGSMRGTGGMESKLKAAQIAMASGIGMVIGNGSLPQIIHSAVKGESIGTFFLPKDNRLEKRKHWIAFGLPMHGSVKVDEGAKKAITHQGKSLLPSGVIDVEGDFGVGDGIMIKDIDNHEIARGLVNYAAEDLEKIKGHHSKHIESILGYYVSDAVVHRDNMARL